jgi:hypothetical protein
VEVGQAVLALDFVDAELDFAEGVVFVGLEVGERDFDDAAFEGVVGVLETRGAVDEGFADAVLLLVGGFLMELVVCVWTYSRELKVEGALIEYQSFRVKGSWALFLRPFLPLERRLFLG